jgi:1,4-dihydroxy-2-naphthoyl-CoA hydrolase
MTDRGGKQIWFAMPPTSLAEINELRRGTMVEHLGIEITALGDDFIAGRMPVDQRTKQPAGVLHGGASVALAESLGSIAANMVVDYGKFYCVGLEINANHVRGCSEGSVEGVARPAHLGRTTQIWEIRITQDSHLVCISRLTMAVLKRP